MMGKNSKIKLSAIMLACFTASGMCLEPNNIWGLSTGEAVVRKVVRRQVVTAQPVKESGADTTQVDSNSGNQDNNTQNNNTSGSELGYEEAQQASTTSSEKLRVVKINPMTASKLGNNTIKLGEQPARNQVASNIIRKLGDVNGDGKLSITDLSLLKNYLTGNVSDNFIAANADVNGDGKITATDLSILQRAILDDKQEIQTQQASMLPVFPAEGLYSLQPACAPNLELTVENASKNENANVFLYTIASGAHTAPSHQKWLLTRLGSSEFYKITAENSGLALNIHNGISANGTNVTLWPYSGNMHEFRFFNSGDGYYYIQGNIAGNYVLDVENFGNTPGTNVSMHEFNGSTAQKWKLVKVQGAVEAAEEVAQRYVTVYNDAALTTKSANRWIGKGETYRVLQDCGTSLKVSYYSSSGQPREGYVNKNIREIKVVNSDLYELKDDWVEKSWEPYGEGDGYGQEWPNEEKAIGGQCFGFANYIFYELHDTICGTTVGNSYIVSNRPEAVKQYGLLSSTTQDDLESIFKDQATPGDFIQGNKNGASPHSMIFMEYDSANQTIWVLDANSDYKNTIKYRSITLDNFVKRFTSVSFYTT